MDRFDVMRTACFDEIGKIAGELQGMVRSGRRPISVENYLERENAKTDSPSESIEEVVKQKISGIFGDAAKAAPKGISPRAAAAIGLGGVATGAVGLHTARQANNDRKLGKQIRKQQGNY